MTEVSSAPAVTGADGPPPGARTAGQAREVFTAGGPRRRGDLARWRKRLSWPLGIYTTPVAILIIWEALAEASILGPTYAPAPTAIAHTAASLWHQGILGPDLEMPTASSGWSRPKR